MPSLTLRVTVWLRLRGALENSFFSIRLPRLCALRCLLFRFSSRRSLIAGLSHPVAPVGIEAIVPPNPLKITKQIGRVIQTECFSLTAHGVSLLLSRFRVAGLAPGANEAMVAAFAFDLNAQEFGTDLVHTRATGAVDREHASRIGQVAPDTCRHAVDEDVVVLQTGQQPFGQRGNPGDAMRRRGLDVMVAWRVGASN